jgi:hypothetical protein
MAEGSGKNVKIDPTNNEKAGPDGLGYKVISLLEVDSLLVFEWTQELKSFLRFSPRQHWIKIHLNPNLQA